ncbi:hypothetical protein P154DRAFT_517925 [Amniculicola lignicola CBS 123094]|uniref:Cora-domain-containing protein n=1 Tax=Amniculicola lignicola CBS 123094 TaxID=1392246 RepID=A0A6A5X0X5_9PLEO|nr:hypothetical protein P154DRAFT_517925 [Amniculicola lignicola CBS 123094]
MSVEELRKQLDTLQKSHDALLKSIEISNGSFGPSINTPNLRRETTHQDRHIDTAFADSSTLSDDSEDEDDDYFVSAQLPAQSYDHEHLREHLKKHTWDEHGREILSALFTTDRWRLKDPHLFPMRPGIAQDRSHYSHYQVYEIGPDGRANMMEMSGNENTMSRAAEIWNAIKDINSDNCQAQKAVGRITIAREPSPILFGALHLTMNRTFDMDELFKHLVQIESSSAHMHRAFSPDPRRQKTFFFNFEYYTIIGEDCKPMQWQLADRDKVTTDAHIPLTRCSATVALALYDDNPRRIRNKGRRAKTKYGWVQNIWSPWQVLVVECFPDWRASTDTFESEHRYLNGPEAFLHALLTEYRDARKRYDAIYLAITKLITPPLDFIFDAEMRDQRLFEDKMFTWTRRYFWSHQTLGNVNDSIKAMVDAFEDAFTDDIWDGTSKTIWPLFEESPRNDHWKRRLRALRLQFEREMKELRQLMRENNERRVEIASLQNQLFSGTSIQESRKSVELSDITVQQGRNIKLLTLVNMIFVPLTFVTSVYGMTNMSTDSKFWPFGVTLATVCVPFFLLIGFLNTDSGYRLWMEKTRALWHWMRPKLKNKKREGEGGEFEPARVNRTLSTEEGMQMRLGGQQQRVTGGENQRLSHPNIKSIVEASRAAKKNEDLARTISIGRVQSEENEETGVEKSAATSKDTVIDVQDA